MTIIPWELLFFPGLFLLIADFEDFSSTRLLQFIFCHTQNANDANSVIYYNIGSFKSTYGLWKIISILWLQPISCDATIFISKNYCECIVLYSRRKTLKIEVLHDMVCNHWIDSLYQGPGIGFRASLKYL